MEKNYLSVNVNGQNTLIVTNEGNELFLPTTVISNITLLTGDEEESLSLLSYLKDRYEDNLDVVTSKYTANFVERLFTSLLSIGFVPDQIVNALDQITNIELFGEVDEDFIQEDEEDETQARIDYICYRVKSELHFLNKAVSDSSSSRSGR